MRLLVVSVAFGPAPEIAMPLRGRLSDVDAPLRELVVMVSDPVSDPTTAGANVAEMLQLEPGKT